MNKSVQAKLDQVERIFIATYEALEAMNDGDRVQLAELAKTVGLAIGWEPKKVLPFVNHFVHGLEIAYVTRGKKGGIIKGVKPAPVAKPAKKLKKDDTTQPVDDSNTST